MNIFNKHLIGFVAALSLIPSVAAAASPTFYRGFPVMSSKPADAMGYAVGDTISLSSKNKHVIQSSFMEVMSDHGGIENGFAPRHPYNKNLIYLGTNHLIKVEGGQLGIFTIWSYNLSTLLGKRIASLHYSPDEVPDGYGIVGNEGTKLVILKNIDGPYCEQTLPDTSISYAKFQSLDLQNPKKGFVVYTPSASMKAVFAKLPDCPSATHAGPDISLTSSPTTTFQAVVGQKFGEMTFVRMDDAAHMAYFTGTVQVTGTYGTSELDGNLYFTPDANSANKLPHVRTDSTHFDFTFSNQDQAKTLLGSNVGTATIEIKDFNDRVIDSSVSAVSSLVSVISKQ